MLGTPDPRALVDFYEQLLGWTEDDEPAWVRCVPPERSARRSRSSTSPSTCHRCGRRRPTTQQMTAHLDIAVEDLDEAVAWALDAGASLAEFQPQDAVGCMLDPAGHPFCLFVGAV